MARTPARRWIPVRWRGIWPVRGSLSGIETVGFFLEGDQAAPEQLRCIAATGGEFRTAETAEELGDALTKVTARALRTFQAEGQPVSGGPAAVAAPVLAPGTYRDTILAEEASYYAVELRQGQELIATVPRGGLADVVRPQLDPVLEVVLADPNLEEFNTIYDLGYARANMSPTVAQTVSVRSGVVGRAAAPPFDHNDPSVPGRWYLRVLQETNPYASDVIGREFPLEIMIEVTGEGIAERPAPAAETAPPGPSTPRRARPRSPGRSRSRWRC